MRAVRWKGARKLSTALLVLLVMRNSIASNVHVDGTPSTPYRSSYDHQFDFADVVQQQDQLRRQSDAAGEITQISTADNGDETFWIKQLGDDFKNAIHMQVNMQDGRNDVLNSANANNESTYRVQAEIFQTPVTLNTQGREEKRNNKTKTKTLNADRRKRRRKPKHDRKAGNSEIGVEKRAIAAANIDEKKTSEKNAFPQTIGDKVFHKPKQKQADLKKSTELQQQFHTEHAPEYIENITETQTEATQNKILTDRKTVEQTHVTDAILAVKIPPVIHQRERAIMTEIQQNNGRADNTHKNAEIQAKTTEIQRRKETTGSNNKQKQNDVDNLEKCRGEVQKTYTPMTMTYKEQQQQHKPTYQQTIQQQEEQKQQLKHNTEIYSQPLQYTNYEQQPQPHYQMKYQLQKQATQYQQQPQQEQRQQTFFNRPMLKHQQKQQILKNRPILKQQQNQQQQQQPQQYRQQLQQYQQQPQQQPILKNRPIVEQQQYQHHSPAFSNGASSTSPSLNCHHSSVASPAACHHNQGVHQSAVSSASLHPSVFNSALAGINTTPPFTPGTIASAGEYDAMPQQTQQEYKRAGRSTHELYQKGLR